MMLLELRYLLADLRLTLARRRFGRALDQLMGNIDRISLECHEVCRRAGNGRFTRTVRDSRLWRRRNAFAWPWGRSVMVSPADAKWEGLSVLLAMSKSAARGYAWPVQ